MSIVFSVVLMMSLVLNSISAFAATRDVPLVSLITWNLSDQQAFRQSMPYVGASAVRVLPDFEPARNGDEISYPDENITDVIVTQIYIDQKERNLPRVRHDYAILIADQDIGLQ